MCAFVLLCPIIESLCPPLAHTIEQIGSIPNLSGNHSGRTAPFNLHPHTLQYPSNSNGSVTPGGRTDLARTIDRIRYAAATGGSGGTGMGPPPLPPTSAALQGHQPGRNFVLQLGNNQGGPGTVGNPPPYCSSESSHDVTPDSGIVSDIHCKSSRGEIPELVYAR